MKTAAALLFLCCWLSLRSVAQPGAFGGSLRFRVFDSKGRLIGPSRSDYTSFPTWMPGSPDSYEAQHPEIFAFARTFSWSSDGYWHYESAPTPAGGIVPSDFTINIVYGRDTMSIRGLGGFSYRELRVDSIPFSPGCFTVPAAYAGLLSARSGSGRITNLGWEFFRGATARPAPIITERLVLNNAAPDPLPATAQSTCAGLTIRYDEATRTSAVYLADDASPQPRLLFSNLGTRVISSACHARQWVMLLDGGEVVIASDDAGTTWRAYQVREDAQWWAENHLEANPVKLERVWLEGDLVLAAGTRSRYNYSLSGTFQLHFDPGTASAAYRRSNDKARADLLGEMQRQKNKLLQELRARRRQPENQPYPLRRFPPTVTLMQLSNEDARRTPTLGLTEGRFGYQGYRWPITTHTLINGAYYDSGGTYVLTDSTITFREKPETRPLPTEIVSLRFDVAYYYYFTRSRESYFLHLVRWDDEDHYEESTSFFPQR